MTTSVAIIEDNLEFLGKFIDIIQSDMELSLVGTATNGADGLQLVSRCRADVYLVDLGLPDMSGTELIKHAVKTYADCDVMVITVFGDDAHVIASIQAGATGYILKDSSPMDIVECIHALRNGGSPISPVIARKILQNFSLEKTSSPTGISTSTSTLANMQTALSEREIQILRALSKGLSFKEIGESHFISTHTVARHVKKIYYKLAVHSRGEAVYEATKLGLIAL